MFIRHSLAIAALAVGSLISATPAAAQVSHLFESKDHYTGPVAKKLAEFKDHYYPAALAFNGDGSELSVNFMVGDDGVHIWKWREPGRLLKTLPKGGDAGDGRALAYSPDGNLLVVRHGFTVDGKIIRVWNAKTGQIVNDVVEKEGLGTGRGFAFSPDGKSLMLAIDRNIYEPGNQIFVYRADTWELSWKLRTMPFQPKVVAMSPDGKLVALGGQEDFGLHTMSKPKIIILDIATRQVVRTIDSPFPGAIPPESLAWSPDGTHLAAGCRVGGSAPGPDAVKIFDVATGNVVTNVSAQSATLTGLSYSPDGRYLIAGSIDDSVRIMDGHDYTLLQKIPGDGRSLAVSRDSHYLAISAFPKISVWELK
jgi:WD40 repeat protein